MIVACQWNKSSPAGPALQEVGGSLCRSCSSFWIRLEAMMHCKNRIVAISNNCMLVTQHTLEQCTATS